MPTIKPSVAFKQAADWISAEVRAYMKDQVKTNVDMVQDVRDSDLELTRFIFVGETGASYRLDPSSEAPDDGFIVIHDAMNRPYVLIPSIGGGESGLNPRGPWNAISSYSIGDLISSGSLLFVSRIDGNVGNSPPATPTTNASWMYIPIAEPDNAYVYIAYASNASGANFTTSFDPALNWIAILPTDQEITELSPSDFSGRWKNYKGAPGIDGDDGSPGWSPVFARTPDGERYVLKVVDWIGGDAESDKPPVDVYISDTGYTTDIAQASNWRGPSGPGTGDVTGPGTVAAGEVAVFADETGLVLGSGGFAVTSPDQSVLRAVALTQAEYDALSPPDPLTFYVLLDG